jgi:hypothetical protein
MKIGTIGFGVGIPRTNLQVSAINIVKIYLRHGPNDNNIVKLGVNDMVSVGGRSGAFIFSGFQTKWFELDPKKDGWARNPISLIGKKVRIKVSGVVAKLGSVDIVVTLFDKYNQGKDLVNQCCIEVEGGIQFSESKVMGVIERSEI